MNEFSDQCNSNKQDIMNKRAYLRNIPSQQLQQYFDSRPVSTKYSLMPIVDPRKSVCVPVKQMPTYNPEKTFNPGNDFGPWSGYAANVNRESVLRNQIFALQDCPQAAYVPSSNSDLYTHRFHSKPTEQPFPYLFQNQHFEHFNPNPDNLGTAMFNNATRVQNRDLRNVQKGTDELVSKK